MFENCNFLSFPQSKATLCRTVFDVPEFSKAELHICGLGFFEAYINGVSLSENRLMPPKSDYSQRDLSKAIYPIFDEMTHHTYYLDFDISDKIKPGRNILCSHVGAGWYAQEDCNIEGMGKWGDCRLIFTVDITLPDGSSVTLTPNDTENRARNSFVEKTNIYFGETVNGTSYPVGWLNLDFDDSDWFVPAQIKKDDTEFLPMDCPADKVIRQITPILIHEQDGVKIYDLGETAAGTPIIDFGFNAKEGDTAGILFGDVLNDDFTINQHYTGGDCRKQDDIFVYSKNYPDEYRLFFTWNAGRFVRIEGKGRLKRFDVIHTDVKQRVFFKCENTMLNWFFNAYVRTQTANIHGCIPSDCPHRERLGYTGDGELCAGAAMSIFDADKMYRKWMLDIRDCQDRKSGHVQHTAPFYGGGGGPGGWGGAAVIVPWTHYLTYGDVGVLRDSYNSMLMYLKYMLSHSDEYVVNRGEKGGWCLGDWCPPHNKVEIPETFVNTYFFAKCADITLKVSEILGIDENNDTLTKMSEGAKKALSDKFYSDDTGSFCGGIQGADAFAVDLGIANERTINNLIEKYTALNEYDTGIFGTYLLTKTLFMLGSGELAIKLLTNTSDNSFYNMKKHGSENLWENWDGCDSLCHPMFGASAELIVSNVLGISPEFFRKGNTSRSVTPDYLPLTGNVHARVITGDGEYEISITYDDDGKQKAAISQLPAVNG